MNPRRLCSSGLVKGALILCGLAVFSLSQPDRAAAHNGLDPQCPLSGGNCPTGTVGDRWFGNHILGAGSYDPLGVGIVPAKERYTAGESVLITFSFPFDFARYGGLGNTTTRLLVAFSTHEGRDTTDLPCASFQPSPSAGQSLEEMPPAKLIKSNQEWNIDGYYALRADGSRTNAFAGTCTDTIHPVVFANPHVDAKDVALARQANSYTGSLTVTVPDVDYGRGAHGWTLSFQVIAILGGPGGATQWSPAYLGPFTVAENLDTGPSQPFQLDLASQCVGTTGTTAQVKDTLTFSYRPSWPVGIHSPETALAAGAYRTNDFAKMHWREYGMSFETSYRLLIDGRLTDYAREGPYGPQNKWEQIYVFMDLYLDPDLPGGGRWASQLQRVIYYNTADRPPSYPIELTYPYQAFQPLRTYQVLVRKAAWMPTSYLSNEVTSPAPSCGQRTITLAMSVRCDATMRGSDGRLVPRLSATWGLSGPTLSRAELHWRASNLGGGSNTDNSTDISPPTPGTFELLASGPIYFGRNIPYDFTILGFTTAGSWVRSPVVQLTIPDCPESQNPPIGQFDPPACESDGRITFVGWARDPDTDSLPTVIVLYRDQANETGRLTTELANQFYSGSGNETIGHNFGFRYELPAAANDGQFHLYFLFAFDPQSATFARIGVMGTTCPQGQLDLKVEDPAHPGTFVDGPITVPIGTNTVHLRWTSANVVSPCATGGNGWTDSRPAVGEETIVNITSFQVYGLICTLAGGTETLQDYVPVRVAAVDLKVEDPPGSGTFVDGPITVAAGNNTIHLRWTSEQTRPPCTAAGTGWTGAKTTAGEETFHNLTTERSYLLTCPLAEGSETVTDTLIVKISSLPAAVDLKVEDPPGSGTFVDGPITVAAGNNTIHLRWTSEQTRPPCTAAGTGWTGDKTTAGEETFHNILAGKLYALSCPAADGLGTLFDQVVVIASGSPTPSPTIHVIGDIFTPGSVSRLHVDPSSVVVAGGTIAVEESLKQIPGYSQSGRAQWSVVRDTMLENVSRLRRETARPLNRTALPGGLVNLNPASGNPFDGGITAETRLPEGGVWLVEGNLEISLPVTFYNTGTLIVTGAIHLRGTGALTVRNGTLGLVALGETDPSGITIEPTVEQIDGVAFFSAVGPLTVD